MSCTCVWEELPNQEVQVKGSVLKVECDECRTRREEQAAAEEARRNDPEVLFNIETFQISLFQALMSNSFSTPNVRNEFDKICAFLTGTKQVAMLKAYLGWLLASSIITEADYAIVAGLLLAQNINLENYEVPQQ